jgi:uncharacterized YigZ family protein
VSKYLTITALSEGFYKEKGSKFYAFAVPCKTEEEAKTYLNTYRKEHHQAVHVCYAFRFGSDKKIYRASDDGEPSNSAGPPILGQIQSFDLTNVLIAVVRYYGGTNLGVGGLITAYRTAAKEALENAQLIEQEDEQILAIDFSYEQMPQIMKIVKNHSCTILSQEFDNQCFLKISFPVSNTILPDQIENALGS